MLFSAYWSCSVYFVCLELFVLEIGTENSWAIFIRLTLKHRLALNKQAVQEWVTLDACFTATAQLRSALPDANRPRWVIAEVPLPIANGTIEVVREFFDGRVVSRGLWPPPPHSPDLTPSDFYLWPSLKHKVYKTNSPTLEEYPPGDFKHFWRRSPEI